MNIKLSGKVLEVFKEKAKKCFPTEFFVYLVGDITNDTILIRDLVLPLEGDVNATDCYVEPMNHYWRRACKEAEEKDCIVVGDLHSHCYEDSESDPTPSFQDFVRFEKNKNPYFRVFGVCEIIKSPKGRKKIKTTFWEAKAPPKVRIVK